MSAEWVTAQTVTHPILENIPYINEEAIPLGADKRNTNLLLEEFSNEGQSSANAPLKLDVFVGTDVIFQYVTDDKTRGVILDISNSILYEYNSSSNEVQKIAQAGRGPGDLFQPSDLTVWEGQVFVSGAEGLISIFECSSTPCQYVRSINLEFVPHSIAVTEDRLFALGLPESVSSDHPLHVFDKEGNLLQSFGRFYHTDIGRLTNLYSEGKVRVDPDRNLIYLMYNSFPLVYVFNNDFELDRLYRVEDFNYANLEIRYSSEGDMRGLSPIIADYDAMNGLYLEENGDVMVRVVNGVREEPNSTSFMISYSHYSIDNTSREASFLGKYDYQLLTSEENLFLNRDGSIFMIDNYREN
ncbi:MAG: hypothetical protein U5K31_11780 [Balneolaceae bacterium]|nr:hypothetical protein [Balneolaceae bacterium]